MIEGNKIFMTIKGKPHVNLFKQKSPIPLLRVPRL